MNEYDTDRIRTALNCKSTDDPEQADIILVNTCAIREKADQKAFSSLGKFKHLKKRNPEMVLGITGCVAQLYGKKLIERMPYLDLVLGPRAIPNLPSLISEIQSNKSSKVETSFDIEELFEYHPYHQEGKVTAFVSIQQGCNKRCSYCIVPTVRGDEANRPLDDIIKESIMLINKGVKEITLIGQTVNSWKYNGYKFGELLEILSELEGLERLRFTTSYPRDVTKKMIRSMSLSSKICNHIHLPVQSGSNNVLKKMKRTYTKDWYIDSVNRLKESIPGISITSDFIVGFPGESDEDFQQTLNLINDLEFDASFSFKFSPRPGTVASEYQKSEYVPDNIASKRLSELQKLQRDITFRKNKSREGRIEQVLVDSRSKKNENLLSGRTSQNRITNFAGKQELIGKIVNVKIKEGLPNSLRGELIE